MTIAALDSISRERVQQLLAAVGSMPKPADTNINATEYNWNKPHCFSESQLKRLGFFVKKIGTKIAREFADLWHANFVVTSDSNSQCFADEYLERLPNSEQDDYYVVFGTASKHTCGVVRVPLRTAITWTSQLLGDTESDDDSARSLSQLEESLLSDVISSVVRAISSSFSGQSFRMTTPLSKGQLPVDLEGTEELCEINFQVNRPDSEQTQVDIVLLCDSLHSVVGKGSYDGQSFSSEEVSDAVFERIKSMNTTVTAELGSAVLSFEQVMSMQPGDILLLDRKAGEPIDVIAGGKTVFKGQPARSAGKYAVVIVEPVKSDK